MLNWLTENFELGSNYLVAQQHSEQLNAMLAGQLVTPFHIGRKHNLWGELAQHLPAIGRRLGWVPNQIPALFLNRSVEEEIADAAAAAEQLLEAQERHLALANRLLASLHLEQIAHRSPFALSDGETKIVWLLTQWVKSPDYLVIGNLPANLFAPKVAELTHFMIDPANRCPGPKTIILGYEVDQTDWCRLFFSLSNWKRISYLSDMKASQP